MNKIRVLDLRFSKRSRNTLISNNVKNLGAVLDLNHDTIIILHKKDPTKLLLSRVEFITFITKSS